MAQLKVPVCSSSLIMMRERVVFPSPLRPTKATARPGQLKNQDFQVLVFSPYFLPMFGLHHNFSRWGSQVETKVNSRIINIIHFYFIHFIQQFHTRLHLFGFGGLGPESGDETLNLGNLLLLVGVLANSCSRRSSRKSS
jgi:hypothetical protein